MKNYCGGSTTCGHGDFAICGQPYRGSEPYQCSRCEAADLKAKVEWRAIESAPKDGTVILGLQGDDVVQMSWDDFDMKRPGLWVLEGLVWPDRSLMVTPSHWMPLPTLHPE